MGVYLKQKAHHQLSPCGHIQVSLHDATSDPDDGISTLVAFFAMLKINFEFRQALFNC